MDGWLDAGWLHGWSAGLADRVRKAVRDERGFTLIELLIVVVIIGVLAAIAIPVYVGQQSEAKDTAAQAQLRTAATAQQLYFADKDAYANDATQLGGVYGFRQGDQTVTVRSGGASYCMDAPGGGDQKFHITQASGKPVLGVCPGGS